MSIREQVARAIGGAEFDGGAPGFWEGHLDEADAAIKAVLEAAAEQGQHIVPDEATEAMVQAGIDCLHGQGMITGGPENSFQLVWRAMLERAPKFEVDK